MKDLLGHDNGARFSECGQYRTLLWRIWRADLPLLCIVMMNPSKAGAIEDDPTISRQIKRANLLGYGGLLVVNVFSWVETDSTVLAGLIARGVDIVGPDNDHAIVLAAKRAGMVICGWGKPGELNGRGRAVLALLRTNGIQPHALAINRGGSPMHPLYIGYDVKPLPMLEAA